jgi:hypothetical protein
VVDPPKLAEGQSPFGLRAAPSHELLEFGPPLLELATDVLVAPGEVGEGDRPRPAIAGRVGGRPAGARQTQDHRAGEAGPAGSDLHGVRLGGRFGAVNDTLCARSRTG